MRIDVKKEAPKGAPRRRKRGLLDLLVVMLAFYAMVVTTPVGGLVLRAYRFAIGSRTGTRPLVSYFERDESARDPTVASIPTAALSVFERSKTDAHTTAIAVRLGFAPDLARAVAIMASNGRTVADGHLDIQISPGGVTSFEEVGAEAPQKEDGAERKEALLIEALAKLKASLGSDEAAVAATAIEARHVRYAMERARALGVEAPERYRNFRAYVPPEKRAEADVLVDGAFALTIAFDMGWPVGVDAPVSSGFGYRIHPVLLRRRFHAGTDLAVPMGTAVHAVAGGIVRHAAEDSVNGRFVKIDHGYGLTSAYCHASELQVRRGDFVEKGRRVALSGASGRATGPHLHLQVELHGQPIDPEIFLRRAEVRAAWSERGGGAILAEGGEIDREGS